MPEGGIGQPLTRKEDRRFLEGRGRYLDDLVRPRQVYAVFVRSPVAHGEIKAIDTEEARAMDGVLAVLTGEDLAADNIGPLPCGWMIHSKDGSEMAAPAHPALARGKVRYVGEPMAIVVARSRSLAKTAAEAVIADIDELPAVVDVRRTQDVDAPRIHDEAESNTSFRWELGDKDGVDKAFADAHHVTRLELINNRLIPNAIEPRAAIGEYEAAGDSYTLYVTSQNPHVHRVVLSAFVAIAPENKLRVVSPDVGGGFGSKIFIYPEETLCCWASKKVGRPVKWTADRSESFLADAHGRDHATAAELALDENGVFLALKVSTKANLGAYLSTFGSAVPTYMYGTLLAGQYRTPAIYVEVDGVFTNTVPVDAYRGAGRPEATYVVERMVESAAREMNMDPAELRRRNFVPKDAFPYETPVALTYDIGDYEATLEKALEIADYNGFADRREEAAGRGKLRGIGLSCYIEACGLAPSKVAGQLGAGLGLFESAQVRVNPTGSVTVYTGTHSHGQGHETTFAQIVAARLGISPEQVDIVHGDTEAVQYGLGTYGSRSLAVGGSAIVQATDKVIEKGRRIAAHLMEVAPDEVDFDEGVYSARKTNKSKTFQEIAFQAYVPFDYPEGEEPGLDENAFYDPANFTYPSGSYVCEVEVDPETGKTEICRFVAVDDFGRVINPMIVEGQVHGGLAQGVGQAWLEGAVYDPDSGQLLTGSYMDYCMPRADDLPNFELDLVETACTHNPLGAKGCGEAGAIGAPAAFINALTNALGVIDVPMPATPERVWRAARNAKAVAAE